MAEDVLHAAAPGDVWALRIDDRWAPFVVLGSGRDQLTNDDQPVACLLDWVGLELPPLEAVAELPPMLYRLSSDPDSPRDRRDGRVIAGRASLGQAELRHVGSIVLLPELSALRAAAAARPLFVDLSRRAIAESWANRNSWTPPNFTGPTPLEPGRWAELVDDDGVIVVASKSGLRERFAKRTFDYDFPKELVEGARDRVVFGWQTEREGEVAVTIARGDPKDLDVGFEAGGTCIDVGTDGIVYVTPYGSFTRACCDGGDMTTEQDDSYAAFRVAEGRYRIGVISLNDDDDDHDEVRRYIVVLIATTREDPGGPIEDVPIVH
jgi:hypothetical protein